MEALDKKANIAHVYHTEEVRSSALSRFARPKSPVRIMQ